MQAGRQQAVHSRWETASSGVGSRWLLSTSTDRLSLALFEWALSRSENHQHRNQLTHSSPLKFPSSSLPFFCSRHWPSAALYYFLISSGGKNEERGERGERGELSLSTSWADFSTLLWANVDSYHNDLSWLLLFSHLFVNFNGDFVSSVTSLRGSIKSEYIKRNYLSIWPKHKTRQDKGLTFRCSVFGVRECHDVTQVARTLSYDHMMITAWSVVV